jgi:apolipoprotein N-acyltransferase
VEHHWHLVDHAGTIGGSNPYHDRKFTAAGPHILAGKPYPDDLGNSAVVPISAHLWPWLNLGNALATTPKLIQWYEFTGVRGGTLWIILTNFAVLKVYHTYRQKGPGSIVAPSAITLIIVLVPILLSYLIFQNFEEEGETVNVALIQPNLDPYTEKFDPGNYARHVESFFKTADAIVDEETQYLFGPETLIVEQIDEKNPTASIYYRDLLEFRKKYQKLTGKPFQ